MSKPVPKIVEESVRAILLLAILAVSLLVTIWLSLEWEATKNIRVVDSETRSRSTEELKNAMRHHGTLSAKQDRDYQWYFTRDGKQCPLFKEGE